jgi:dethiobiotin synthetase
MSLPRGLFITATDTGVGKTVVSTLLVDALHRAGRRVGVLKPYAAGGWEDTDALIKASGCSLRRQAVSPVFFAKPLSPAVRDLRTPVDSADEFRRVKSAWAAQRRGNDMAVMEGIGGALCPVGGRLTIADVAAKLSLPAWVVARPSLGTLNHTLLTVEALSRRKVKTLRIVVSGYTGDTEAERTNPLLLSRLTGLPVTLLPRILSAAHRGRLVDQWAVLFS